MEIATLEELSRESARWRFRVALGLAVAADALQIIIFPFFAEGAASPSDDVLDSVMAGILFLLLGWHWEFLPSFLVKLVPGVDLVPTWTLGVFNVYRKWKKLQPAAMQIDVPNAASR